VEFEIEDGEQALVNVPGKNNIDLIKSCLTYSSDNHIFQLDQLGMGLAIGPLMNLLVWFMVFNATFNIISVMSWSSFLLVEETGVPGENHRPVASHWQKTFGFDSKIVCLYIVFIRVICHLIVLNVPL